MERMEPGQLAELIARTVAAGQPFVLKVTGNSMLPTLRPNRDEVELVSASLRPVRRGEIVLFARRGQRPDQTYVLHRVWKVLPQKGLVMNGDFQNWKEVIGEEQVIAVVRSIRRRSGKPGEPGSPGETIREVSCDSLSYRMGCLLWRGTRPFRGRLVRLCDRLAGRAR